MNWTGIIVVGVAFAFPLAAATDEPCIPTSADPSTYNQVAALGRLFYAYENNAPAIAPVAVPLTGLVFGDGTNVYEESNGLHGLQRHWCHFGGFNLLDARTLCLVEWWPPGCDQNPEWQPTDGTIPCLLIDDDPVADETCGAGSDTPIF